MLIQIGNFEDGTPKFSNGEKIKKEHKRKIKKGKKIIEEKYHIEEYVVLSKEECKKIKKEKEDLNKISEAKNYLNSTDWYIIRELENEKKCPKNIKKKRKESRLLINEIEKNEV